MKITIKGNRVLLKKIENTESVSKGGIIIPETIAKDVYAEIVALGKGRQMENGKWLPIDLAVGNRVKFPNYGFEEVKVEGNSYWIGEASAIEAVYP